jgi:hypothetical protein
MTRMRVLWLAAALLGIVACAQIQRYRESEKCLELSAHCHQNVDCCSRFCANGDCVENPHSGD